MAFEPDVLEDSGSFAPDGELSPKKKPTALQQAGGVAQGVLDFFGAVPGVVGGTAVAAGDMLLNQRDPREALQAGMGAAHDLNLGNLAPSADLYRQTEGYKYSPGTIAGQGIGMAFEGYGKMIGWLRTLAAEDPGAAQEAAEKLDATGQLWGMVMAPFAGAGRGRARPGTPEAVQQAAPPDAWRGGQRPESFKGPEPAPEVPMSKRNQADLFDKGFVADEGLIPPGTRSPYNLPKEEAARISGEIMQEVTPRGASEMQGQIFGERRPYTPDELAGRRFVMDEPQRSMRDAPESYPLGERALPKEGQRPYEVLALREMGELEPRPRGPEQAPLEFNLSPVSEFGAVGEARKARALEADAVRAKEAPIEPTPELAEKWRSVPRSQRGAVGDMPKRMSSTAESMVIKAGGPAERGKWTPQHLKNAADWIRLVELKKQSVQMNAELKKRYEDAANELEGKPAPQGPVGPGKSQMGGINPEVFQDIVKIVKEVPKSLEHAKELLERRLATMHRTKDYTGVARVESAWLAAHEELQSKGETPLPKGPGKRQGGWIGDFEKKIEKKGLVSTLAEFKKQFAIDRRPIKDVIAEEKITPETLRDVAEGNQQLASRLDRLWEKGLNNFAIDKTISILANEKGPVGKLIKAVVDQRREATREKDIRVREREQAILRPYQELHRSDPKALQEMHDIWVDNVGKAPLQRKDFRTEKQWHVFSEIQRVLKEGWEETNKWRQDRGLKPIPWIDNYFSAVREGDYWIRITDNMGNLKWASAHKTIYEANKAREILGKDPAFKDLQIGDPFLREKGPYDLSNLSAFEETLRALSKDDPITHVIQAKYAELAGKKGFGKTAIFRRGIPGALGFERGEIGVKNMGKVLEEYIRRQEAYIANLKIAKLREQVAEIPKELKDKMPLADQWINEYLNHSLGMDLSKESVLRYITENLTETAGFGRQTPRNFLQGAASVASLMWLSNLRFAISQMAQPLIIIPKLLQMKGQDAAVGNFAKAYWDGQQRWFTGAKDAVELAKWAGEKGYLDSAIAALLDLKATDVKGNRWGMIGAAARWPLAKLEKGLVRGPVLMILDSALKDSIKDKHARWETAAELMDYYMTHYDRESSPLMYNKLGYIGDAARPLKQYSHNNFGQFFEYVSGLKNRGEVTPLASYMGLQALVGGLKGIILVAEATAIITMLNSLFDLDIPTPEQKMLEAGFSDWLVYGGLSTTLGYDVSSSVAAPSMPNMFSLPGVEFAGEAAIATYTYLMHKVTGKDTDADAMRAMLALTPKAMHGWVEELFMDESGIVPNPRMEMKGVYRRNEEERLVSEWTDLKSVPEQRKKAEVRITKQLLQRDAERKMDTLDAMASAVANGQPLEPELIKKYIQEGGDVRNLAQNLKERIISRNLTWEEEQYRSKKATPAQIHKLDKIKEILDQHKDLLLEEPTKDPGRGYWPGTKRGEVENPNIRPAGQITNTGEIISKQSDRATFTEMKLILSLAKRLFPDNFEKQKNWAEKEMFRRAMQPYEVQEQIRNFYDEPSKEKRM